VASQSAWAPAPPEKKLSVGDALPLSASAGFDPLAMMISDAATSPIATKMRSATVFVARISSMPYPRVSADAAKCVVDERPVP